MKKALINILLLVACVLLAYLLLKKPNKSAASSKQAKDNDVAASTTQNLPNSKATKTTTSEQNGIPRDEEGYEILPENPLKDYATKQQSAQDDFQQVVGLVGSYHTLIKGNSLPPFSENKELVEILRGKNPYKIRFLQKNSPHINKNGELVDRWGSALFFHPVASRKIGIRMAGPDKILWTDDDLHSEPESSPLYQNP